MNKRLLVALVAAFIPLAAGADSRPANLDWLVGHWCGGGDGKFIEEHWLDARGDVLLGLSRTVRGPKTASFEFLRIEWLDGVPSYIAQPQGQPPVSFKLKASGQGWARFENPEHDFPTRVEYRRTQDGLHAQIAGPGKDGKEMAIPFHYTACD